jgi:hypothetical protein
MPYQVVAEDGSQLDAHFDIDAPAFIYHARGGARGASQGRLSVNLDYERGLRVLLALIAAVGVRIRGAWVDSSRVQGLPLSERQIFGEADETSTPDEIFRLLTSRMKQVGRVPDAGPRGGNSTKRIRVELAGQHTIDEMAALLKGLHVTRDMRSLDRLPAVELERVTAEHIWGAVRRLIAGERPPRYGPSTDFDLLADDGSRLPPKAAFGMAASEALGFPVLPQHFTAGIHSPCFRILEHAGYRIVPKGAAAPQAEDIQPSNDREWQEGSSYMRSHLAKERGRGLAEAKKAQYRRIHGRLTCERCGLDPIAAYRTVAAEACIEVHHSRTQVAEMSEGHRTVLDDVECLCANCHRLVHRFLQQKSIVPVGEQERGAPT